MILTPGRNTGRKMFPGDFGVNVRLVKNHPLNGMPETERTVSVGHIHHMGVIGEHIHEAPAPIPGLYPQRFVFSETLLPAS